MMDVRFLEVRLKTIRYKTKSHKMLDLIYFNKKTQRQA